MIRGVVIFVVNVGVALIAKVVPVPVCDAIVVAFPTDVIGPVRFAFVTTVVALPTEVTIPVKFALVVTVPAVKFAAMPVSPVPAPVKEEPVIIPEALIVVIPLKAPADETLKLVEFITRGAEPPPMVTVPVEVPVLILVAKLEEALMLKIPPEKA